MKSVAVSVSVSAPGAPASAAAATKVLVAAKISMLSPDRVKVMEIVLQKLKMSPSLMSNALITIDEKILTLNNL